MTYDVTAFGEILIDFTYCGNNERGIALFAQNPGGAPGNVCVAINRLGGNSAFMGKVGKDMHGDLLRETLEAENVNTEGLISDEDVFTTLAFVNTNDQGERFFSFSRKPGADTRMTFEEMPAHLLKDTKIFHVGSLSLTHEPAKTATHKAIEAAKNNGVLISYDPNYRDSLWPNEETAIVEMRSLIPDADIMKISDEETELLTGKKDPAEAAQALIDAGVKVAAITLGANGALVANKEGQAIAPGFKPESIADTNGAGDTFWGAFLYQIARADKAPDEISLEELKDYATLANAAASLTCTKPGAIPAMPNAVEVEELLEKSK